MPNWQDAPEYIRATERAWVIRSDGVARESNADELAWPSSVMEPFMWLRNFSFDLLSFIGAVLMAGYGVTAIIGYRRGDTDFTTSVICVGMFLFLAAMLLLMSLRLGDYRKEASDGGTMEGESSQSSFSHGGSPGMRSIQRFVWSGVICLVLNVILMTLAFTMSPARPDPSKPAGNVATDTVVWPVIALIYFLGMLLLMVGSVGYAFRWAKQSVTRKKRRTKKGAEQSSGGSKGK